MRVWEFRTSHGQNAVLRIYNLLGIIKLVFGTQVQVASASINVIKCSKSERRRGKIIASKYSEVDVSREGKSESTCIPRGHWYCLSLCQSDVPCNWSLDVETTGQLWQPAGFVGTFPHLHSVSPIPVAVSLPVMLPFTRVRLPLMKWDWDTGTGHHGVRDARAICCRGNRRWNFEFMWGEGRGEAETSRSSYHSYSIAAASKFVSPHCDWVGLTDTSVSLMAYNSE